MRRRTRAREAALQFLYQVDLRGPASEQELTAFLDERFADDTDPGIRSFAEELIRGTQSEQSELDQLLRRVAKNWDLHRMAVVDRNVLRMASYEMLRCPDVPAKVSINEAIEMGKKFSTANSGKFINGILDRIRIEHEGEAS